MEEDQQFCLRWNNHQSTLISVFDNLLASETLVDCTLAAEGKYLKAHKVVLSACSPYFANLLKEQYDKHPIFILKDVKYQELRYMMDYMYRGEVNISQDQLPALLKAAESLQIKGLSDNRPSVPNPEQQHQQQHQQHHQQQHQQHHRASLPTNIGPVAGIAPKYPGTNYTLEQTKRARMSGRTMGSIDTSELDSREGSSSPSRKLRKMRRKSNENATNDTHDNSNSSQLLQSNQQQQVANANIVAGLSGVGGISAVASALAASSAAVAVLHTGSSLAAAAVAPTSGGAGGGSSIKKTDSLKATSQTDAMNIIENSTPGGSNLTIVAAGSVANALSDIHHHHQYQTHHTDTTTGGDKIVLKQKLQQQQQPSSKDISANQSELVIEPKSEYDDDANDEAVEDLTLDEEDMGMEDLDQKAGPSQGGEGSSQGYAPWQQDQSQDELLLNTQEAQQRDPQVKHDKSEQTDITPEEFELDDCLLESNDIVITQNKDGFVLHVKKLGNITTAKISSQDDKHTSTTTATGTIVSAETTAPTTATVTSVTNVSGVATQPQIMEVHEISEVKPTFTTLTTSQAIKLPSSECELINLKKIIPSSTTIAAAHHPHTTIIQAHELHSIHHQQQQQSSQPHQQHHEVIQIQTQEMPQPHHHHQQQQQQIHHTTTIQHQQQPQEIIVQHQQPHQEQHHHQQQHHQLPHHAQVQSIVTTAAPHQTINLMGLHNVQITEQKPLQSRIKYSRGKIITPSGNVQIVQTHEPLEHDLTEATKYEISEIDLNNPQTSAAIISDLVKYAEIDDIELPDGTKIGIGFASAEITEHMQGDTNTTPSAQIIDQDPLQAQHQQTHTQTLQAQIHHIQSSPSSSTNTQHNVQVQQQNVSTSETATTTTHVVQHLQLQEQDDKTTSLESIIPDTMTVHEQSTLKSYTILTARPLKQESSQLGDGGQTTATTYELSLSDSSMGTGDERGDEAKYVCRHCNKKYRWKSTLRRHENVECGGKEPCHPCPYCSYKAKQRGNLGVHVRKHHPDKPQLESKRGRKI